MTPGLSRAERHALRRAVTLLDLDRRRLLLAVLAGSAGLGSAVALAAVSAWLIARASQMPPVLELTVATVAVRTFGISRALLRYLERLASHEVALRGMAALREHVYRALAAGRVDAVVGLRRGDLLARTGQDVDAVGDVVVRALLPGAVAAVVGAGSVLLVGWLHPGVGVVLAGCLILAGVVGPWLNMRAAGLAEQAGLTARTELSAAAMTLVDGAAELTVSGRAGSVLAGLRRTETALATAKDAAARPAALAAGVDALALGVAVLGALLLGVPATVSGALAPVELAVVVLTPLAAFEGTALLGPAAVQLVRSGDAAVRVMELLDSARPCASATHPAQARTTSLPATTPPVSGPGGRAHPVLVARDLAVGWPAGAAVADQLDLDMTAGRAVAVVGPSGVGKTTLLMTLAGLLSPRHGTVTLDGMPVAALPRQDASRSVVLTAEDAHVFRTTVLENLRVARGDLTEVQARDLLTRAGLGTWLAGLPDGLGTMLGPDAATISGGERRRLLLARALASPAPLLLLDEPAEHLDPATADHLVTDLLRTATRAGRGVVLATHRLAALGAADEVVLLGTPPHGHGPATVLARGSHDHLLATVPEYRWAAQQEVTARPVVNQEEAHVR